METLKAEVEAYLKHILDILEEDVTFEIEDETPDGLYVNLVGSMFSLPEERPIPRRARASASRSGATQERRRDRHRARRQRER